ncbi:MAG: hypothetical protein ACSHXZ_07585 [Gammaproteobacteria bacterium]
MQKPRLHISSLVRASLLTLICFLTSIAQAQNVIVQNNELGFNGGSSSNIAPQTQTISEAGLVGTFTDLPATGGFGIPSFNFTLAPDSAADGQYHYRVGITIDDDTTLSRLEAKIENLVLTVNGSTITGNIPAASNPNGLYLLGRDANNVYQLLIKIANDQASGPLSVSGASISFNSATLIDRIKSASNSSFETNILNGFNQTASYSYRIVLQQTSTTATGNPTLQIGTTQSSFVALPKVVSGTASGNDVQSSTAFELSSGELSPDFPSAFSISGRFKVNIYDISADSNSLTNEIANISLPSTGEVSADTKLALYAAMTKAVTLLTNTEKEVKAGNLQTDAALSAIAAVNTALAKVTSANISSAGIGVTPSSASIAAVANIAKVIAALQPASDTLTTSQKDQISTLATSTVSHVANVLKEGISRSSVNGLVTVTSQLVTNTLITTGDLQQEVTDQLKALGNKAGTVYVAALPTGAFGAGDITSLEGIKALADTSPTVKDNVLKASPTIASGNTTDNSFTTGVNTSKAGEIAGALGLLVIVAEDSPAAIESGGNLLNVNQAITSEFVPDSMFVNLLSDNDVYAAQLDTVRVASDLLSDGVSILPNGQQLAVNNGIAVEIGGAPVNNTLFTEALTSAGYTLDYVAGGNFSIGLPNNERFSGTFPLQNVSASSECTSVSFTTGTGAVNAASYAFEMVCNNGVTQQILPVVLDQAFYTTVADAGIEASTDKKTGIVTIPGVGSFKPSFFVTPHSAADAIDYNASKNAEGIGFRASDKNGDGKVDYEILSSDGVQVLYSL